MKSIRVVTIGVLFSWIVLNLIYVPFTQHFLNSSKLYAFSMSLGMINSEFHSLSTFILITSVCLLSIGIGMFFATFVYSPIEKLVSKTQITHKALDT